MPFTDGQMALLRGVRSVYLHRGDSDKNTRAEVVYLYLAHVLGLGAVTGITGGGHCRAGARKYGLPEVPLSELGKNGGPNTALIVPISADGGQGVVCAFADDGTAHIFVDDGAIETMRRKYAEWLCAWLASEKRRVLFYGAGEFARTFAGSLRESLPGVAIEGMLVTSEPPAGATVQGIPVMWVDDAGAVARDTPVVVATDMKTHSEIMNTLAERNFTRVFPMIYDVMGLQAWRTLRPVVRERGYDFIKVEPQIIGRLYGDRLDPNAFPDPQAGWSPQPSFSIQKFLLFKEGAIRSREDIARTPHWLFFNCVTGYMDDFKGVLEDERLLAYQREIYGDCPHIGSIIDRYRPDSGGAIPEIYMMRSQADHPLESAVESWGAVRTVNTGAVFGKADDSGEYSDNVGDNISLENRRYSEMSGVYWLWKHAPESKYVGVSHYRRHFALTRGDLLRIANSDLDMVLSVMFFTVPGVRARFLFKGYLKKEAFAVIDEVFAGPAAEYRETYKRVMEGVLYPPSNLFIMRWEWFHRYCEWLFPVMEKIENLCLERNIYSHRDLGFVTEFLMAVFVAHHKNELNVALADRILIR